MLILAAIVAMILANSAAAPGYFALLDHPVPLGGLHLSVQLWVNDALMALFFLTVGLEIRRELTGSGHLNSLAGLRAPGLAALGGMVAPAAIYLAVSWPVAGAARGWAVPIATDIAFSLAVLEVLGSRVKPELRLFLTALAIVDDLAAIMVIALFYSTHLRVWPLLVGLLAWLALLALRRARLRLRAVYLLGGVGIWLAALQGGVHPTLAGVALALAVPGGRFALRLERQVAVLVAFVVLPLFGLANAGVALAGLSAGGLSDRVLLGVTLGLLLGKPLGVYGAVMLGVRSGFAQLPPGLTRRQMFGIACLCGIGFTMSLFIGDLAFRGHAAAAEFKPAVFVASIIAALLGLLVLAGVPGKAADARRPGGQRAK